MKKYLYAVGVILIGFVLLKPSTHEEQLVDVAAKVLPTAAMITVTLEEPELVVRIGNIEIFKSTETVINRYRGSGVLVSDTGHILSCAHLFNSGKVIGIDVELYGGMEYAADLLSISDKSDLALIKINEKTPHFTKLADPRKLKVGQEVIAVGYPLSLEFSVTHGIISALYRDIAGQYNVTQSDTSINPGNSGGPLFNLKGELVGINSFMVPPVNAAIFTGCGFSVQVGQIIEFLTPFKLAKVVK